MGVKHRHPRQKGELRLNGRRMLSICVNSVYSNIACPSCLTGCTGVTARYLLDQSTDKASWRLKPARRVSTGDSRCVACRDGQAIAMTEDHKPTDAAENERIVKASLVCEPRSFRNPDSRPLNPACQDVFPRLQSFCTGDFEPKPEISNT